MVGLTFFVRRSFLGVRHAKNIKISDIKIFGLVTLFTSYSYLHFKRPKVCFPDLCKFKISPVPKTIPIDNRLRISIRMLGFMLPSSRWPNCCE